MKKIIVLIAIFNFAFSIFNSANAQLMTINDAKTKIELGTEYRGGTPISDNSRGKAQYDGIGNPEGNIYTHLGLWHNFIFSPMTKVGLEGHHMFNDGEGNGKANHYMRLGANASHIFLLPGYTRGISLTANLYGEASQYGVHRFDGVLSSIFLFSMDPKNTKGVGFVWLLNNPQHMFGLPIFLYKRDWGKRWSINFMTWMADFSYHFNDRLSLAASYGFGFERYWFKPADEVLMDNQCVLTPTMSLQWKPCKGLSVSVAGGYNLAFMNTIMNAKGTELLDRRDARLSPYANIKCSYSIDWNKNKK